MRNRNRVLSMKVSGFFGLAMSIDSLAAGTFAAFLQIPVFFTLSVSFLFGMAAQACGQRYRKETRGPFPPGFFLGERSSFSCSRVRKAGTLRKMDGEAEIR